LADVVRKAVSTNLKNTCRTKATGRNVGRHSRFTFHPNSLYFSLTNQQYSFSSLPSPLSKKEQSKKENIIKKSLSKQRPLDEYSFSTGIY
jgi:hypothetical protein